MQPVLRSGYLLTARAFCSSSVQNAGIKVRSRLHAAVRSNRVPEDEEMQKRRKDRILHQKNISQVKNASAQALLGKLLNRKFDDNSQIGPLTALTDEELDVIFRQRNLRLKYKVLGTSGNQLKNSLIVDRDVAKYLERGEVYKAIWMARLAGEQGTFATGSILKYLLSERKLNSALNLFNDMKKRGQRPDGRVLNILFTGFANSADRTSPSKSDKIPEGKAEALFSIFSNTLEKDPNSVSIVHVNSLLKAFRSAGRTDLSIQLFDKVSALNKKQLEPDVRTYTEMFSGLRSYSSDFQTAVKKTEELFSKVQKDSTVKIDPQLMRSYSSVFIFANDPRLNARAITILREWYRICSMTAIKQHIDWKTYKKAIFKKGPRKIGDDVDVEEEILLPLSEVNYKKTKRFEPDETITRRYASLCDLFGIENDYKPRKVEPGSGNEAIASHGRLENFVEHP